MRFLHCADIHLDSPLRGLERYEGAPLDEIRGATRRAFARTIDLALDERVDFVLLAGDLYDGDWKDYNTGLFFTRQMQRLLEADIRVFVVAGNHDAASQITRVLRPPENVTMFASNHAETVLLDQLGVAIHGQGFATASVTDNLAASFPARHGDLFNIGLLHTSLDGRPGHANYAPCSVDTLRARGYDYWALGHVHARELVSEAPWIVFPGNLQGRHARETGTKGCTLVSVEDSAVRAVEHRDVTDLRWERVVADASGMEQRHEVYACVERALVDALASAEGRLVAVRLQLKGATALHRWLRSHREELLNECRAVAQTVGGELLWLEKVQLSTAALLDERGALARDDALGGLLRAVQNLAPDASALAALGSEFDDLALKLPSGIRDAEDGMDPRSPALLAEALEDVKALLLDRLLAQGDVE